MTALVTCEIIASNLIPVNLALVESLSGGLSAQVIASNLKIIAVVDLSDWSSNFIVNFA